MKTHVLLFAAGLLLSSAGLANAQKSFADEAKRYKLQEKPDAYWLGKVETIKQNYGLCLETEVPGIVESALGAVAQLGLIMPETSFDGLKKGAERQSAIGSTPTIRFKAYLTSLILDNPQLFTKEREMRFDNADELFSAVTARLQKSLLGAMDR